MTFVGIYHVQCIAHCKTSRMTSIRRNLTYQCVDMALVYEVLKYPIHDRSQWWSVRGPRIESVLRSVFCVFTKLTAT